MQVKNTGRGKTNTGGGQGEGERLISLQFDLLRPRDETRAGTEPLPPKDAALLQVRI